MVCMEAMARASSTEAFKDVPATIVRADEVVAMDAKRTLVGLNSSASSAVPAVGERDHVTGSGSRKLDARR
jgi:hypothetical protein